MRQVMLMISKGTQRLPTVRELESRGIQVSSAVKRERPIKIEINNHADGMAATHCAVKYLQEGETDESRI
ncbi:hypothetical protein SYK_21870 [Pseudodesulfovibrio nedwellii]|uniref:Uncharacterized protein n=1 Tax=Pseudodesulfovibrio nedwellii TaxID=2973072 RepID=A0ABN6S3R0_9BACT|nr:MULTISPECIES: hypothetical protein [Pseudodesulfovibrio]BDQ37827.1 hypothetical protein SYK_21870 [Pseudodesulfovibrio nedwellii]